MIDTGDLDELTEIYTEDIERLKNKYGVDTSDWEKSFRPPHQ